MGRFTVHTGKRYQATVALGFVQRLASNERVAEEFRKIGFTDVIVTGSGRTRLAKGLWPHEQKSAEIPDVITNIREIGQIEV